MRKANNKRLAILAYIAASITQKGYPPTVREICEHIGLSSTSTVHAHLKKLQHDGYITKDPAKPRTLEVTKKAYNELNLNDPTSRSSDITTIPLVGVVTAGQPILATENISARFPCPPNLNFEATDLFMLKISGDSMIEAGILDGDFVIVRKQQTANSGDIVIAMVTDQLEATCKKFYQNGNQIRLQPCNETLEPFYFDASEITLLGKVRGVYREL